MHDILVILGSVLSALVLAGLPLWFSTRKAIAQAKDEMYAVQHADQMEERRLEIQERVRIATRMQDIVAEQDRKLADFGNVVSALRTKVDQCEEDKNEYRATTVRYASELKIAAEYTKRLEECVRRYEKLIDTLAAKLSDSPSGGLS
jgi:DNA repair ATPase RecN